MSDNWVVQNLENALETWNSKLSEIWQLLNHFAAGVQRRQYLVGNGEYQRGGSGYRSCPACSVFCCRCGSHLRKLYRCKETGTRIKAVYPLCHCQRCDYLRAGAYACPVRHRTRYDFNHYDICWDSVRPIKQPYLLKW